MNGRAGKHTTSLRLGTPELSGMPRWHVAILPPRRRGSHHANIRARGTRGETGRGGRGEEHEQGEGVREQQEEREREVE